MGQGKKAEVSRRQLLKGGAAAACATGAGAVAGEALAETTDKVAARLQPKFRRIYLDK